MSTIDWGSLHPSINLLAAAPGSGKSHLIKYLIFNLWKMGKFHHGVVFCPTAHNGAYDWMPKNVYLTFTKKKVRGGDDEPW